MSEKESNTDIRIVKSVFSEEYCKTAFDEIKNSINWQNELTVAGTTNKTKINRYMSYVTDKPVIYSYANLELQGETWIPKLVEIRDTLIGDGRYKFNSVLLNLYEDGKDEIRWHSDKEKQLGSNPIIACVNLGATRKFWFLEKATGVKTPWEVSSGDILIMGPNCQENYLHAILKEKDVTEPRISLTYRWVSDEV